MNTELESLDRDALRKLAKERGVAYGPNSNEATLRAKLSESEEVPKRVSRIRSTNWLMQMPKLKPCARPWGGRMYRIKILVSEQVKRDQSTAIAWDDDHIEIAPDMEAVIPEPHYNILRGAKIGEITKDFEITKDGVRNFEAINYKPAVPFQDYGVTPETAHLCGSVVEWMQRQARERNYFEDESRSTLEAIFHELTDKSVGREKLKTYTDDELLVHILSLVGLYDEVAQAA